MAGVELTSFSSIPISIQETCIHIGGKAKNLHCLKNNGFQVPTSWVIPFDIPLSFLKNAGFVVTLDGGVQRSDLKAAYNFFDEKFFFSKDYKAHFGTFLQINE